MDKRELAQKFQNDVKKRSRFMRFLLVLDQMFNVLFWNGSQDETISSHIGRKIEEKRATKIDILLCKVLKKLQSKHCQRSIGE